MFPETSRQADPLIGTEIGEYRIVGVLGRGGMGVVYEAEDTALGISVALKMIDPGFARDASFVRRFRAEARAMARLPSPHIVRVMAMRQTEEGVFIVMEYVDGGTLHDKMEGGPVPWERAWPYVCQMLLALEKAHGVGVVHRDIKPRNIMLTEDGTVKVTDFGLAKLVSDDPSATVTQAVAGTLLYMSPEQVRASPSLDGRSDLFALGLVVYEMLAGRLPFDRDAGEFAVMRAIAEEAFPPPTKFNPAIPAPVARAVMKALEKDPDKRYATAAQMREALEKVAPSDAATAAAAPRGRPATARLAFFGGGAVLAVLLLAGTILLFTLPSDDAAAPDRPPLATSEIIPDEGLPPLSEDGVFGQAFDEPEAIVPEAPERQRGTPETPRTTERTTTPPPQPPAAGTLAVSGASGVTYTVAGSRVDGSRSLPPGTHTVRCEAGGLSAETRVQISSGQTAQVVCHSQQQVNVSAAADEGAAPWMVVVLNGENTSRTTPAQLTLGPGRHTITLQREGYEVVNGSQVVEVRPSFDPPETRRLSFRVRPI
jgi:predicted Ser/Thr protein kinase